MLGLFGIEDSRGSQGVESSSPSDILKIAGTAKNSHGKPLKDGVVDVFVDGKNSIRMKNSKCPARASFRLMSLFLPVPLPGKELKLKSPSHRTGVQAEFPFRAILKENSTALGGTRYLAHAVRYSCVSIPRLSGLRLLSCLRFTR